MSALNAKALDQNTLTSIPALLNQADAILIGAGAGLSAAAGINYLDQDKFAQVFPGWVKKGFTAQYQLMGYPHWTQLEQWGYYKAHLEYVYFGQDDNQLYRQLRRAVADKDYFVMTSNVDGLFYKNGFDKNRFYSPQGDYGKIQCTTPCSDQVWDIRPFLDQMEAYYDADEQVLTDEIAIPRCPNCGGEMFIHARIDGSFIDSVHEPERIKLIDWLNQVADKQLLLLDLGSGFNTPTVIRMPMEQITMSLPNANLIRVNLDHAEVPAKLATKAIGIEADLNEFIEVLTAS
ncbi:hypothetical protein [Shewanella pealeana]|uniref:Deacetylase sirtuin-type domain-containing protein n=1 Tax=Shewanella pealeana (strain ATCC 700345 / ANG-SQ1) TaxID=398579 RepID=A8H4N4_SHEPA|nr:hypothetical protein [Shewanella pealeana]ABV87521.1 conserved hypothetical protein [Shewanella pealeana ATCC 700345]